MAKIYSASQVARKLGLPHQEVIRRLHRNDIEGQKLGWNWVITEDALEKARSSEWYQRRQQRHSAT